MNMKIKILETSYDDFSLIINEHIIVNLGKECVNKLLKDGYDLTKIDTVIFTNMKQFSILDYPIFLVSLDKLGVRHRINVYIPKNEKQKLSDYLHNVYDTYFDAYIEEYFVFTEIYDKLLINDSTDTYKFLQTSTTNYGVIINDKLGFTGFADISNSVKETYKKSDLIIVDCSLHEGNTEHMGLDDLVVLTSEFPGVKVIPIFINDEIIEELKKLNINNVIIIKNSYTLYLN